jgi:hypothetical protein
VCVCVLFLRGGVVVGDEEHEAVPGEPGKMEYIQP